MVQSVSADSSGSGSGIWGWNDAEEHGANITPIGGSDGQARFLVITQSARVHEEIRDFLALLRQFR